MALYEGKEQLEARGAMVTSQLPAHILFGDNADEITNPARPQESTQELELRVSAGNAAGMAAGYYSLAQHLDEDGNVSTEEEKQQKIRQRLQSSGMAIKSSAPISFATYQMYLPTAQAYQAELESDMASIEERLATLEAEKAARALRRQAIEAPLNQSSAHIDALLAEEADAKDTVETEKAKLATADAAAALPFAAIGEDDGNMYVAVMVPLDESPTGMLFVAQNPDGTPCRDANGAPIVRDAADPNILTSDEAKSTYRDQRVVSVENSETNLANVSEAVRLAMQAHDDLYARMAPQLEQLRLQDALGDAETTDLIAKLEEKRATYDKVTDFVTNGPDAPDARETMALLNKWRTENGQDALPDDADPDLVNTAMLEAGEGLRTSIENDMTAIESHQSSLDDIGTKKAYLEKKMAYLDSETTIANLESGNIDELAAETYDYDPGYWNDFYDRFPSLQKPESISQANPDIYPAGGMRQTINMSLPSGEIGPDGQFIPFDRYGPSAHIPAYNNSQMSASAGDGLGIAADITPRNDFSAAASGQPVNQSVADPAMLAQIKASLNTAPESQQVAMSNNAAYTP